MENINDAIIRIRRLGELVTEQVTIIVAQAVQQLEQQQQQRQQPMIEELFNFETDGPHFHEAEPPPHASRGEEEELSLSSLEIIDNHLPEAEIIILESEHSSERKRPRSNPRPERLRKKVQIFRDEDYAGQEEEADSIGLYSNEEEIDTAGLEDFRHAMRHLANRKKDVTMLKAMDSNVWLRQGFVESLHEIISNAGHEGRNQEAKDLMIDIINSGRSFKIKETDYAGKKICRLCHIPKECTSSLFKGLYKFPIGSVCIHLGISLVEFAIMLQGFCEIAKEDEECLTEFDMFQLYRAFAKVQKAHAKKGK